MHRSSAHNTTSRKTYLVQPYTVFMGELLDVYTKYIENISDILKKIITLTEARFVILMYAILEKKYVWPWWKYI